MPIALPGFDRVAEGSHRDLLVRLHALYGKAGKPATRLISKRIDEERLESVSYETASALLSGKNVPGWSRLESIVRMLCRMSVHKVDENNEVVQLNVLWQRYDAHRTATAVPALVARNYSPPLPTFQSGGRQLAPAPDDATVVPRVHGALPERAGLFTGREQLLDEIESRFSDGPGTPLVLFGPLGSGKTQLAAEYVRMRRDRYAVTWWVEAETVDGARDSLLSLAHNLGVGRTGDERRPFETLFLLLEKSGPYLLVFDGVVSGDVRTLIRTKGGNVIVTTRNGGWARDSKHAELEVPDLDGGESAQLLRKQDPHLTRAQIASLTGVVGRSPIGLTEACRLYREHAMSWDDLTHRVADPAHHLLTGPTHLVEGIRSILRDRLAGEPGLQRLLTLLLGFGPSRVWRWTLQAGAERESPTGVHHILRDQAGLKEDMRILASSGLGRRHIAGEWIEIPAIVRLALRELLPLARSDANRQDVVEILIAADPGHPDDPQTSDRHRAIAPHVRPAALAGNHRPAVYRMIWHQIRYLFRIGELQAAQQLGREAEEALGRPGLSVPPEELVLRIRRDLANALRADGRYPEAFRLTEEAMARIRDSPDHRAVALELCRSRGHDLRIAGQFQRAYDLDEQTLRRHAAAFPDDDFRTLASRYNLSVSRRFLGRFGEAAKADRHDLDRLRPDHGRPGSRHARWANALAEDLYGLGRFSDVVELLTPVVTDAAGRELQRARRTMGVAFRRLGKLLPAVEQLGVCYQACLSQLGDQRELTLAVCMSFGNALRDLGQYETAMHYCSQAVKGYTVAMGADNPLVQVARVNLAAVQLAGGDVRAAAPALDEAYQVLADRLGDAHPFTVIAAVNRASAAAMTDPVSAWTWSTTAYERARATFRPGHLDTLVAAAGFAADRAARNENDHRAPTLDQVLATLRRRFGADHPLVTRVADGGRGILDIELPSG